MLSNLFSKIESLLSLGNNGPWWWRFLGTAISVTVLVAVWLALRH
jgi:hypothetical protein